MVAAAFPLLLADLTTNAVLIAGVLVALRLPWVLSLFGGALVDRLPLRRLLPTVDAVRFVVVAALAAAISADLPGLIPMVYLAALVVGAGDTILASGLQTAVPALVPDDQLDRANGVIFVTQSATEHLSGPALGGLLFGVAAALPFGADALTFLVSAALLVRVLPTTPAAPAQGSSILSEVREGAAWYFRQPDLRDMTALIGSFSMLQGAVLAVLVILVDRALGGDSTEYGLVLAGAAVGNLVGGAIADRVNARVPVANGLFVAGLVVGVAYVGLGLAPSWHLAALLLAVEGLAIGIVFVAALGYRQRRIPREMLGRGSAALRLVTFGLLPVGAFSAGAAAELTDIRTVVVAIGTIQIIAAVFLGPRLIASIRTHGGAAATSPVTVPAPPPSSTSAPSASGISAAGVQPGRAWPAPRPPDTGDPPSGARADGAPDVPPPPHRGPAATPPVPPPPRGDRGDAA